MVSEEPRTNPYVSPPTDTSRGQYAPLPVLPVEFKPSKGSFLLALPFAVLFAHVIIVSLFSTFNPSAEMRGIFFLLLIAAAAAVGTVGCISIFWIKVVVTEDCIQKQDLNSRTIAYEEIEGWRHQAISKTVTLYLRDGSIVHVHNWAMTREKCQILGCILLSKIGPPRK